MPRSSTRRPGAVPVEPERDAAFESEEIRERLLRSYGVQRLTSYTITDEVELGGEYEHVRDRGYSIDAEESVLEGRCFGAPIVGPASEVVGALSVSVPKMRVQDKETEQHLIKAVRRAAQGIASDLAIGEQPRD
jgi:IclR family transcriptional regulator, acetate operon repressor